MNVVNAILLGLVQGLTEFLPISSSGHLVLGKAILGIREPSIVFEVFVHFGTLLSVVLIFRKDILNLIQSAFRCLKSPQTCARDWAEDASIRLLFFIILGTIPAVVVGLLFESAVENAFSDPRFASGMLLVTAAILFATLYVNHTDRPLTTKNTIVMGFAQALAILPGISRSGSTISFGLFLKVSGDQAARFSFLLSIPAILGATILKSAEIATTGINSAQLGLLALGTLVAFLSGTVAIKALLHIVQKGKLYWFSPYCLIIGLLGLLAL